MTTINFLYKTWRLIVRRFHAKIDHIHTIVRLKGNGVCYSTFRTGGVPYIMVAKGAKGMIIGKDFSMNNTISGNPIGVSQPCIFFVDKGCSIAIGENVGLSQVTLNAQADIVIGNRVKIGGGTCIYTSDFHSLDARIRSTKDDLLNRRSAPVFIKEDVFIGAKCTILKGVTIGEESIIGAGSVVTKDIPARQIWAGNPAKFIRNV